MVYYFVKITLLLWQRIYFKRIYVAGAKSIPQNKPVFLASNHSNGFLDGVMVSALLKKPTYIFVRGDVFKKKWADFFLRTLKLIPIFRARDGQARENLVANNQSFDQLYEEFKKKHVVLIFPEADAVLEKHLRPLKKGMARIVADMETREEGAMEVAVVPFGLNYTGYKHERNELMLSFGKPLYLDKFLGEEGNQRKAQNMLTKTAEKEIRARMVDINHGDEELTETALRILRSEWREPLLQFWYRRDDRLKEEVRITNMVKEAPEEGETRKQLHYYQTQLDKHGIKEVGSHALRLWQWVFMVLGFVPAILSWMVMRWGLVYGRKLVDEKVKKEELYESVYFGIGLAWNWVLILVGYPVFGIFFGWKGLLGWCIFRWFSVVYQHISDFWEQHVNHVKWKKHVKELEPLRTELVRSFHITGK